MGTRCIWFEDTGRMTDFIDAISSPIKRNMETGEECSSRDLPPGALYALTPDPETGYPTPGPDGFSVVCVLPNGNRWYIDGRARNCTMKDDKVHRCWVRHGTVGERLHVDKVGNTCAAGRGSIQSGDYHGHLHNGELVP